MLFNPGIFLGFFLGVYLLYLVSSHRLQNRLLLVASYVFYGYWDYRFLGLILVSTAIDYVAAQRIHSARQRSGSDGPNPTRWLWLSIVGNLGILGFFKYFGFFADGFSELGALMGWDVPAFTLQVVLPVGISFYTFQSLGYTLDVYRRRIEPTRDLFDFALFVAFFPQLMAGPIERAKKLIPQLQQRREIRPEYLQLGAWLIFWGLFKKVFIADNLAPYTFWGSTPGELATGLDTYLWSVAFTIRFYCDFSGYSDMARGLALLLGVHLSVNFHLPYFASNPAELWSRWHMTLTRWFRDNVYGPLRSIPRALAVVLTMTLVGLWHGANWTFVVWGFAWGMVLVGYRISQPWIRGIARVYPSGVSVLHIGGVLLTFHIWIVLGQFFALSSLEHAVHIQWLMLTDLVNASTLTHRDAATVLYYVWPLVVMQVAQLWRGDMYVVFRLPFAARYFIYLLMFLLLLANGGEINQDFIYFQF